MQWFDPYEIRARIAPAAVVLVPVAVAVLTIIKGLSDTLDKLFAGGVLLLVLVYALSFVVRHFARQIEPKLWKTWDGPPTTRFMRWRDDLFSEETKLQFHAAVDRLCSIKLSSQEEELNDPKKADAQIEQAFIQVRAIVRREDPSGLWFVQNAEYGFNRNLLGSRKTVLVFSILGAASCATAWYFQRDNATMGGLIFNILFAAVWLLSGWHYLPRTTKTAADRYAETIWGSFLAIANKTRQNPPPGS